jgi:hypothetical protein
MFGRVRYSGVVRIVDIKTDTKNCIVTSPSSSMKWNKPSQNATKYGCKSQVAKSSPSFGQAPRLVTKESTRLATKNPRGGFYSDLNRWPAGSNTHGGIPPATIQLGHDPGSRDLSWSRCWVRPAIGFIFCLGHEGASS